MNCVLCIWFENQLIFFSFSSLKLWIELDYDAIAKKKRIAVEPAIILFFHSFVQFHKKNRLPIMSLRFYTLVEFFAQVHLGNRFAVHWVTKNTTKQHEVISSHFSKCYYTHYKYKTQCALLLFFFANILKMLA